MGTSLPWGDDYYISSQGFHSINVPSEWGLTTTSANASYTNYVSIQLMSPASGDKLWRFELNECASIFYKVFSVSIQLMSPASGDGGEWVRNNLPEGFAEFPFN